MDKISINFALCESKSLRNDKCQTFSDSSALEVVNKAKSLVMAVWQSKSVATTKQLAEFYEVSEDTVQSFIKNNRDELVSDGLKTVKGKELKDVVSILDCCKCTPSLTLWTPLAALRLGMLLRDSDVADKLRSIIEETEGMRLKHKCNIAFREYHIEKEAKNNYGGSRQHRLKSRKRIDIIDGICITEIKKGLITARHVGQLFEYLSETGIREGRLIGKDYSECAIELCKILRKSGYIIELVVYQFETN